VVENEEAWGRMIEDTGREDISARRWAEQRNTEAKVVFNAGAGIVKVIVAKRQL